MMMMMMTMMMLMMMMMMAIALVAALRKHGATVAAPAMGAIVNLAANSSYNTSRLSEAGACKGATTISFRHLTIKI